MKTIKANVIYPVYGVTVEVEDNATEEQIREALLTAGDYVLESSSIDPIITECSLPQLNTGEEEEEDDDAAT